MSDKTNGANALAVRPTRFVGGILCSFCGNHNKVGRNVEIKSRHYSEDGKTSTVLAEDITCSDCRADISHLGEMETEAVIRAAEKNIIVLRRRSFLGRVWIAPKHWRDNYRLMRGSGSTRMAAGQVGINSVIVLWDAMWVFTVIDKIDAWKRKLFLTWKGRAERFWAGLLRYKLR